MTTRDEMFAKFGPLLCEAFLGLIYEEFNRIRHHIGMPGVTKQQLLDALNDRLQELEPYDWSKEDLWQ